MSQVTKLTPEQIAEFRRLRELKLDETRCPSCSNLLSQDQTFKTIWYCKNKQCRIANIIVVPKPTKGNERQ